MEFNEIFNSIIIYAQTQTIFFFIGILIFVIVLFLLFKPNKKGDGSSIGMSPFELEVFKRKQK
jgi:hypothetical protein